MIPKRFFKGFQEGLFHSIVKGWAGERFYQPKSPLWVLLTPEFGSTVSLIEADGFRVSERLEMILSSDSPEGIGKAMGLGMIGFAQVFSRYRPEILVLLGDRFDMLPAPLSALTFAKWLSLDIDRDLHWSLPVMNDTRVFRALLLPAWTA